MEPTQVVHTLCHLAAFLDQAEYPSRSSVASALVQLILATDPSFAEKIIKSVYPEVMKILPVEYKGELHDVRSSGAKGFIGGYISFGFKPSAWVNKINGTVLVAMQYNKQEFTSQEPESGNWEGRPEDSSVITMTVEGAYYNHINHQIQNRTDLGSIEILVDNMEDVKEVSIIDPSLLKQGLTDVIDTIQVEMPKGSKPIRKPSKSPETINGIAKHLHKLISNSRGGHMIKRSEIDEATKHMPSPTQASNGVAEWFRQGNWTVDEQS